MTPTTLRKARRLAELSGDDQPMEDIVQALCGYGPLRSHTGDQLARMLLRHLLRMMPPEQTKEATPCQR